MSPRQWVSLAMRLCGLWLGVTVLIEIPGAFLYTPPVFAAIPDGPGKVWALSGVVLTMVLKLAVAVVLLVRTGWLVDRAFGTILSDLEPADSDEESLARPSGESVSAFDASEFGREDIVAMALAVFGLVLLVKSVPPILGWAFWIILPSPAQGDVSLFQELMAPSYGLERPIPLIAEALAGLALFARSNVFATIGIGKSSV